MKPLVSIIMGSTSDLPVMEKACKWLNDNQIPFEVNALSCLLYTSPSPRDRQKSRMPSSA